MRGDAGVARADHRVLPAEPADGGTAAAGLPFVARLVGVVEIRAAGALQEIARGRRLVAKLSRGPREQRAGEQAIVAPHARVGGKVGIAHQRADAQASLGSGLDPVERKPVDIDQMAGRFDLQLHQVEQVGAAGDEPGVGGARGGRHRLGGRVRALVGEGFHAGLPATSVIASTMLE